MALFAAATLLVAGAIGLSSRDEANGVAVIFAPWTDAAETLSRAVEPGGRFVRFGGFSFIAVVMPAGKNYAAAVRRNGAWFLADPKQLAACLRPIAGAGI